MEPALCAARGAWFGLLLALGQVLEATELSFRPQDVLLSIDCSLELLEQNIYIFEMWNLPCN